jgi:hypothetical protein
MSEPRRGSDRLALALLVLLPTLLFGDVILGLANFAMRDLTRYYYPTKQIYRSIAAGGEFPLWNRSFHAGQPLAANPEHAIFYPFTWLVMLPSYDLGFRLHILVHVYVALIGMYALLRSMQARAPAALFGAISWGLGGTFLSYINLLPILFCASWLPLTCLYVRRFLRDGRRRDFAFASFFLGLQCLAAEPTTLVQTGLLIGMYALFQGRRSIAMTARNIGRVAAIVLGGVAVGAVQLLAAVDHAGDSSRARPFAFDVVESWSMPWAKLIEVLYPNVLGHVQVAGEIRYWGEQLYAPMGAPFLYSIYPGLAVGALIAAGIARRSRGAALTLASISISIVLALGSHTPLLRVLYDSGLAAHTRYPEKFILIAVFAGTVFAARVLSRLLDGDESLRRAAAGFAAATSLLAAAALLSVSGWWPSLFGRDATSVPAIARGDWALAIIRGLILVTVLLALRTSRIRMAAAFVFLCADLLPVVHELNPRMPSEFFASRPPVVGTLLPNHADYRVFHLADWQVGDRIGLDHPAKDARHWIAKNGLFPMTGAAWGIQTVLERDYDETALLPTVDLLDSMWAVRESGRPDWMLPFGAMSNAWYLAVPREQAAPDELLVSPVEFLEGKHHPRYYFAERIVRIRSREDFVRRLSREAFPDRVAFISAPEFVPGSGTVVSARETANSAVLEVATAARSFLIMSVTPHKYWRVTIDGGAVEPLVTNIGYQGVVVEAGLHQVTMSYRNEMIIAGGVVSVLAAMALAALVFLPAGRRVAVA